MIGIAIALLVLFGLTVREGFAERGVSFSFAFLDAAARFEISEGWTISSGGIVPFASGMTNIQALVAGLSNTLKVAVVAIVLATIIGVGLGLCRLSSNWLLRNLAFWTTEFVRNTPLLIQLTFWYVAVVLKLPAVRDAPQFLGVVISQQGLWLPRPSGFAGLGGGLVLAGLLFGVLALAFARGRRRRGWPFALVALGLIAGGFALGFRLVWDLPEIGRFRATGGLSVSPEYAALMVGITVNTAAYLGEIVRGAIEALPRGQWEAAEALGLPHRRVLGDVVLPQVFRVVLPAFGNQYVSLAKNTSLGIAIGYPDLFNVYGTISNQTGRSLEGVLLAMGIYLLLSWLISLGVNALNRRLRIPGVRR